jgi:hypothetical protein
MQKRPDDRFTSGTELHQALRELRRRTDAVSTGGGAETGRLLAKALAPPRSWQGPASTANARARWTDEDRTPVGATMRRLLDSRWGLTGMLAALGIVNWIETNAEDLWSVRRGDWLGYKLAGAFSWFEQGLSFERHDLAGPVAVYLGSAAYFFLPIFLLAVTLVALIPRRTVEGFRIFVFAIAVCYVVSLPFYLFLPVPERWAYPESSAMLLSDLWSAYLIETVRPISGLDNCFPSFHVSGTVELALVWYVLRLPLRHAIAWLAGAVLISTFTLGIHWLADILAGVALGCVAVRLALMMNEAVVSNALAAAEAAP